MMSGKARAQAVYNAVSSSNANFSKLSAAEQQQMLAGLQALCTADVAYLTGAMQVNPGTLASPAGQAVSVAGATGPETGTTTAPSALTGIGTVS